MPSATKIPPTPTTANRVPIPRRFGKTSRSSLSSAATSSERGAGGEGALRADTVVAASAGGLPAGAWLTVRGGGAGGSNEGVRGGGGIAGGGGKVEMGAAPGGADVRTSSRAGPGGRNRLSEDDALRCCGNGDRWRWHHRVHGDHRRGGREAEDGLVGFALAAAASSVAPERVPDWLRSPRAPALRVGRGGAGRGCPRRGRWSRWRGDGPMRRHEFEGHGFAESCGDVRVGAAARQVARGGPFRRFRGLRERRFVELPGWAVMRRKALRLFRGQPAPIPGTAAAHKTTSLRHAIFLKTCPYNTMKPLVMVANAVS